MANASIFAAFERMWQHINIALNNKSDISHTHDERYYTKTEVDAAIAAAIEAAFANIARAESTSF